MNPVRNTLKFGHFNVRKATDLSNLVTLSRDNGYDLLLLSEINPVLKGLDNSTICIRNQSDTANAGILILNLGIAYKIRTQTDFLVSITLDDINLTLTSTYIRPVQFGITGFEQLLQSINRHSTPRIIAGDVNARHESMGDSCSNDRGTDLLAAMSLNGWKLMNQHGTLTFDSHTGKSINDWAFHSSSMTHTYEWSIDHDFEGMSDHSFCKCILTLQTHIQLDTNIYFSTKVSTNKFIKYILEHTKHSDMSTWYTHFANAIKIATSLSEIKSRPKYWTPELIRAKNKLHKEQLKLIRLNIPTFATRYIRWREAMNEHRSKLREACKNFWEEKLRTESQVIRQMKKARSQLVETVTIDNRLVTDATEVGEAILDHHFPFHPPEDLSDLTSKTADDLPFTHPELNRALQSFAAGKCPGEDHITIQTIKIWYQRDPNYLLALFNHWYANKIYPEELKDCLILPIKKDKNAHNTPQNTRPIGLLMVIGKVYEKLLDSRLRFHLFSKQIISAKQHGFRSCHSILNALDEINEAAHTKEFPFRTVISWDIAGAFNNINQRSIIKALADTGIHRNTLETIKSYLTNRTVSTVIKGKKVTRQMNKGVVQGSKLSPTLFILGLNKVLASVNNYAQKTDSNLEFTVTSAYADDISVVLGNKMSYTHNINKIAQLMNIITSDLDSIGLKLAAKKTQMIHLNCNDFGPAAFIHNTLITPKPSVKILGVFFDQHLTFDEHLKYVITKGYEALRQVNGICSRKSGLDRDILKRLVTTIIAPRMHHASSIWLSPRMNSALRPFNKALARAVTGTWSSASYCSSIILLPCLPIYWQAEINSQMEVALANRKYKNFSIARKIDSAVRYHPSIDYSIPISGYIKTQEDMTIINEPLRFFTDGSKYALNGTDAVGAALVIMHHNDIKFQQRFKLNNDASVFEAEWFAIGQAIELISKLPRNQTAHILSDSLSCLNALNSNKFNNDIVDKIKQKYSQLRNNNITVNFWHVKAHVGIIGNEAADAAAKTAAVSGTTSNIETRTAKQIRKLVTSEVTRQVNAEYLSDRFGVTIKRFCSNLFDRRKELMIITRSTSKIYSGHVNTLHHNTRMGNYHSAECPCGDEQDIIHLLTRCPLTQVNNFTAARTVGLDTDLLQGNWTTLSNTRAFHKYIAERAHSLIAEIETMNSRMINEKLCLGRLVKVKIAGQVTAKKRQSTSATTPHAISKKQRLLKKQIDHWRKHNLEISINYSTETCWSIFKKRRIDDEVTDELRPG